MQANPLPTYEFFASFLSYDPESGKLIWKHREETSPHLKTWNKKYAGKIAGSLHRSGYIKVTFYPRTFLAHRIAWLLYYGEDPTSEIDHKNRNTVDNRIANLRLATPASNRWNSKMSRNNTSGHPGVYFITANKRRQWRATVNINGKNICIGHYDTMEEAIEAYRKAANEHRGEFVPTEVWEAAEAALLLQSVDQ